MSYMKRFAEMVAQEMGRDELDDEVLAEAQRRLDKYRPIEQCTQDGLHLTSCDDDGYCNYCGEQDAPIMDRQDLPDNGDEI